MDKLNELQAEIGKFDELRNELNKFEALMDKFRAGSRIYGKGVQMCLFGLLL